MMLVSTIIPIYFKNMATASGISAANSTAYGKDVGISDSSMLLALLLTQVVAFPCSSLFGKLARKYESEKLISVCIGAYFLIALMFVLGFITFQLQRSGSFYGRWKTSVFPMLGRKPL